MALYKVFEGALQKIQESENSEDLLEAEKIGLEVLALIDSFFGKNSLYGMLFIFLYFFE